MFRRASDHSPHAARCSMYFHKARCIFRTASDHSPHADRCSMYFHKPSQASHSFCPDCMCFHVVLWAASDHSPHADRCSMYSRKPSQASHSFCPDCMCFHVVLWCLFRFPVELKTTKSDLLLLCCSRSPRQMKLRP